MIDHVFVKYCVNSTFYIIMQIIISEVAQLIDQSFHLFMSCVI